MKMTDEFFYINRLKGSFFKNRTENRLTEAFETETDILKTVTYKEGLQTPPLKNKSNLIGTKTIAKAVVLKIKSC